MGSEMCIRDSLQNSLGADVDPAARGHLAVHGEAEGFESATSEPLTVGADRIINTLAAVERYRCDTVVVDFGTATTFDCITADGRFIGGVIMPGLRTSADHLTRRAAPEQGKVDAHPPQVAQRGAAIDDGGVQRGAERARAEGDPGLAWQSLLDLGFLWMARDFVRVDVTTASHSESRAPVYLFKHNIMRDVAYNTLLGEQQRELHLEVAEALEALRPSDIEELAHHYYHSDTRSAAVRKRALDYLARAAARAQNDYANDTALLYYGRAAMLEPRAAFIAGQVVTLHILGRRDEAVSYTHLTLPTSDLV